MHTHRRGDVKDLALAEQGKRKIEWANQQMPVLQLIRKRFIKEQPLKGVRLSACLHVTSETANLAITLRDGGADVVLCASNPLSTQDEVAASPGEGLRHSHLRHQGRGQRHLLLALERRAGSQAADHHGRRRGPGDHCCSPSAQDLVPDVIGGTEETTTGVIRLRAMAKDGTLKYPVIAVNDAETKHLFDNRYGTGQSTIDGIHARHEPADRRPAAWWSPATAGAARGVAMRAKGLGADVIVTEINPVRAHRSGDGRLPRDAHGGGREDRRHLRHRHRQQVRAGRASISSA